MITLGIMNSGDETRTAVRDVYSEIADRPEAEHPFPVGRRLAEGVGYPASLLDSLPNSAVEAFAGVSYVWGFADLNDQSTVLDLGCGAGLDALIAARTAARVVAVDFSPAMLARAQRSVAEAKAVNIDLRLGSAEAIPVADAAVDCAVVNGIFNLNPARDQIFKELARVIRPGGHAYVAELIRIDGAVVPASDQDWFS